MSNAPTITAITVLLLIGNAAADELVSVDDHQRALHHIYVVLSMFGRFLLLARKLRRVLKTAKKIAMFR